MLLLTCGAYALTIPAVRHLRRLLVTGAATDPIWIDNYNAFVYFGKQFYALSACRNPPYLFGLGTGMKNTGMCLRWLGCASDGWEDWTFWTHLFVFAKNCWTHLYVLEKKFYAGCSSCRNPPHVSGLGTGIKKHRNAPRMAGRKYQ